ncbi:MAG TPA: hypothetical protein VM388_13395 [Acidimicrobiales bacterium]|nr:hypothetical protein [Acidimicrobiales bacterium]
MDQPTAEEALRRLEPLVGEWVLEATWPNGEQWPGGGRATFEWHAAGAHLIGRTTADLPEAPETLSVIGCDAAKGTYSQLYSDDRGVCRIYDMSIGDGEWKLWREGEPFSQRFVATISDDGDTIAGRWEIAEDFTTYTTDFHLTYRRAAQ